MTKSTTLEDLEARANEAEYVLSLYDTWVRNPENVSLAITIDASRPRHSPSYLQACNQQIKEAQQAIKLYEIALEQGMDAALLYKLTEGGAQ